MITNTSKQGIVRFCNVEKKSYLPQLGWPIPMFQNQYLCHKQEHVDPENNIELTSEIDEEKRMVHSYKRGGYTSTAL